MTFPDSSEQIVFNMFDQYRNGTIHIQDWIKFMTYSYEYMQKTPLGIQRLNFDSLENPAFSKQFMQLNDDEIVLESQLNDIITQKMEYQINFKEYLAWFTQNTGWRVLKN